MLARLHSKTPSDLEARSPEQKGTLFLLDSSVSCLFSAVHSRTKKSGWILAGRLNATPDTLIFRKKKKKKNSVHLKDAQQVGPCPGIRTHRWWANQESQSRHSKCVIHPSRVSFKWEDSNGICWLTSWWREKVLSGAETPSWDSLTSLKLPHF